MAHEAMVKGFIDIFDFEMLQQVAPDHFDWNKNFSNGCPPLFHTLFNKLCTRTPAQHQTRLKMISWMLRAGADPLRQVSSTVVMTFFRRGKVAFKVCYDGHSAFSYCFTVLEGIQKHTSEAKWSKERTRTEEMLVILSQATSAKAQRISVRQGVVNFWESVREMDSTYNVIFEAADGEVAAHDLMLMAASPVLRAMLESAMKEGANRRILVRDSSSSSVTLFVDMLYTGSTCLDLDYKTMLGAFDLAHRWQVQHVVDILVDALCGAVGVDSFVEITEAAILKDSGPLKAACAAFGAKNAEIQAMLKKNSLPAAVRKLMGEPETERPEPGKPKRRRL